VAAALGCATLLGAGSAGAADDPASAPAPCNGVLVSDAAGDQLLFPTIAGGLTATASKGPDNTDIRKVFFNRVDGVLTANIQMTKLDKTYPSAAAPNNGVTWAVWFDVGDSTHYVKAVSDGMAITYKYGGYSVQDTAVLAEAGDTTGGFFEGDNGIVSIVVPAALVPAGAKLDAVSGRISFKKKDADNSYSADRAPDAAADDPSYTPVDCPKVEATATPTPEATAVAPVQQPAVSQTPAAQQPAPAAPAATKATSKKKACKKKAKKIKNKHKRAKALKRCKKLRK
jgi:hypothetical protein